MKDPIRKAPLISCLLTDWGIYAGESLQRAQKKNSSRATSSLVTHHIHFTSSYTERHLIICSNVVLSHGRLAFGYPLLKLSSKNKIQLATSTLQTTQSCRQAGCSGCKAAKEGAQQQHVTAPARPFFTFSEVYHPQIHQLIITPQSFFLKICHL